MIEPAILVEGVHYRYTDGFQALKDINLKIDRNEFVGIIGQNGAGKSTLLKNIIGLLKPSSGRVLVMGNDTRETMISRLSCEVGFVLQNPDLQLFARTVEEEIAFGPNNLGIQGDELEQRIDEVLKLVGLEEYRDAFPPALSKGDRAKVVIASVLAMKPEIIIFDEPTCGQDHGGCYQIMNIASHLHQIGKTIIFVTHHMSLVAEYAERIIVLKSGGIFMDDTVEQVFSRPEKIIKTHIKPPEITRLGQRLKDELKIEKEILTIAQLGDLILEKIQGGGGDQA